jgi:formate/nitrite transporter FocA (FNT family)
MVCLAVVLAMTTTSAVGKVVAAWLPIFIFFAQGFEHLVVNFFVIPAGMMMGAKVTLLDWLIWNAVPVALGNIVGGFAFTGLAIYWTFRPAKGRPAAPPIAAAAPAE